MNSIVADLTTKYIRSSKETAFKDGIIFSGRIARFFLDQVDKLKTENKELRSENLELKEKVRGSTRIGFKLETGIKQRDLIHRAVAQIEHSEMTAVVANRLEDLNDSTKPRGYLVDKQGSHFVLESLFDLCDALRTIIERGD